MSAARAARRRQGLVAAAGLAMLHAVPSAAQAGRRGRVLAVGPRRALRRPSEAATLAADGDIVEIDAGTYEGDVAVWRQDRLTIRANGGGVVLKARGAVAEGKAIWVVRGGRVRVEGVEFSGARAAHRNGAGIRFEAGQLALAGCRFLDNENGILTASDPGSELHLEACEFGHNGAGDGYSHNLYANFIALLAVRGCYFHHARVGHLLKSRAARTRIECSRFTDEAGGRASYELEFPNGGDASVTGCIVEQAATTENPVLVAYGAEGLAARTNRLVLLNNTLVDRRREGGRYVAVWPGERSVLAANNLLLGAGSFGVDAPADLSNNLVARAEDFADAAGHDYRLRRGSPLSGRFFAGSFAAPGCEYVHPCATGALAGVIPQPGAMQSLAA